MGGCGVGNSENLPLFRVAATRGTGTVPIAAVVPVRWWVWMVDVQLYVIRVSVCPVSPCVSRLPPDVSYRYGSKPPEGAGRTRVNAMGVCVHVKVCLCEF